MGSLPVSKLLRKMLALAEVLVLWSQEQPGRKCVTLLIPCEVYVYVELEEYKAENTCYHNSGNILKPLSHQN
jgi:hypothetical protein